MDPNALRLMFTFLSLVEKMAGAAANIKGVLETARAEGRDLTDDEVKAVMDETDAKVAEVRNLLA